MRGQEEVTKFASEMLETLNRPKNAKKEHWNEMTWQKMLFLLEIEVHELREEIRNFTNKRTVDKSRIVSEATDVALFAMFIADKFRNQ